MSVKDSENSNTSIKPGDTILVTGASGFIGGHLAHQLFNGGYKVRALYRREKLTPRLISLQAMGADIRRADLTIPEQRQAVLEKVDAVVHVAGLPSDWGDFKIFKRVNYDITAEILMEAEKAGCRVFVYISSISVHGFGEHRGTTESGPYYPLISHYQQTKKMAEDFVLRQNKNTFRTCAVRPGNVYGPGDTTVFFRIFD
ncbi:MAG: NAD-dependent epimerase/dehydratase family protein, partial [Spirochaetota bacterium]